MRDRLRLEGKAAVVIGGGQGMGEATSLALAEAGCSVAVVDLSRDRAEAVVTQIRQRGGAAHSVVGDVLDDSQVDTIVDEAWQALGGLDAMVTIIGSTQPALLVDTSAELWDAEHRINVRYCFLAAKAFSTRKIAEGTPGAITFVSSGSGLVSAYRHAAYGAAKAGLIHLTKSMALEWGPYEIRVNSVAPGPIITPRLPDSDAWREAIQQSGMPLKRRGTVEDIANAILFLSSGMANFITGQTLSVDGGVTVGNQLPFPASYTERQV
jgi:NAD(P)-dependent dehydrogenase (short-subunit alcohol dehydrogenase family)